MRTPCFANPGTSEMHFVAALDRKQQVLPSVERPLEQVAVLDHSPRAVDELTDHHRISDETWTTLAGIYTEMQLIEVPMLSGHYAMLAGALNSFGVPPEGPLPALGEA